jgi:hypothetical protein
MQHAVANPTFIKKTEERAKKIPLAQTWSIRQGRCIALTVMVAYISHIRSFFDLFNPARS